MTKKQTAKSYVHKEKQLDPVTFGILKRFVTSMRPNGRNGAYHCPAEGCQKVYSTRQSLARHFFLHTPHKLFECKICSKKFALKQYLREHENTHLEERPYPCKYAGCGAAFN